MAQGLQVFDENGKLDVDVTNRLPRFLGRVVIDGSSASGVVYNDGIKPETEIWWFLQTPSTNFATQEAERPVYEYPKITKGNGFLRWQFPSGRKLACTMLYGVY